MIDYEEALREILSATSPADKLQQLLVKEYLLGMQDGYQECMDTLAEIRD
ncbi:hypothetical protein [Erwinia phage Pecta]|nr:hypothetical protein [Erwinia phage Pecta]